MAEIFSALGILAIVGGGLLAAFSARRPTHLKAWLSAYLVLVAGITQFGLAIGWQRLGQPAVVPAVLAFCFFNLGNLGVITGTVLARLRRSGYLVNTGGGLLAIAMILLAWSVSSRHASWTLVWFLALVIIILVSMPIGLILSARRHRARPESK